MEKSNYTFVYACGGGGGERWQIITQSARLPLNLYITKIWLTVRNHVSSRTNPDDKFCVSFGHFGVAPLHLGHVSDIESARDNRSPFTLYWFVTYEEDESVTCCYREQSHILY